MIPKFVTLRASLSAEGDDVYEGKGVVGSKKVLGYYFKNMRVNIAGRDL